MFSLGKARATHRLAYWGLTGTCLGLAALSRTILFGVSVGMAVGLLFDPTGCDIRTRFRRVSALLAVFALTLSPWVIRNQIVFASPVFGSTLSGYNLYRHNYIVALPEFHPHYVGSAEARTAIRALIDSAAVTGNENEQEMNSFYAHSGLQLIASHPLRYAQLVGFRFVSLWFALSRRAAGGGVHLTTVGPHRAQVRPGPRVKQACCAS